MNRYLIPMLVLFLISAAWTSTPNRAVTGNVTDASDGSPLPGVNVTVKGTKTGVVTDSQGKYSIAVADDRAVLIFSYIGYETQEILVRKRSVVDAKMVADVKSLDEVVVTGYGTQRRKSAGRMESKADSQVMYEMAPAPLYAPQPSEPSIRHNTEEYDAIREIGFREATKQPLSTFSIDVDAASYSNIRRFIQQGQRPPKDAVRIEEMVNYFTYAYPQPKNDVPFTINTELAECPWNKTHQLLLVGLQGKKIPTDNLPPSNLVFLIDVSGSMNSPEKLPLLQSAFSMLAEQLRPQDRVAIVVYAGAAGLVLPATNGNQKARIREAIQRLEAGGSTAGGAGIELAYKTATENFVAEGNNRVILATDGDFNVGASSNAEMERLIEEKRESGVFLTVLGFGMGNYKDSKMETLADKGNGNYAYIDNITEARKVLVNEFGGTLFTIAKDVKLQLEFNPAQVKSYRLIGYENRALANEDFHNDQKDAGELGSGHTVTALYEIIPAGSDDSQAAKVDELKYQKNQIDPAAYRNQELLTLKLRYKQPAGKTSQLLTQPVPTTKTPVTKTSENFRFAASVAAFGMLLRDSEFRGNATYTDVLALAEGAKGNDKEGYRAEFIRMVQSCQWIAGK